MGRMPGVRSQRRKVTRILATLEMFPDDDLFWPAAIYVCSWFVGPRPGAIARGLDIPPELPYTVERRLRRNHVWSGSEVLCPPLYHDDDCAMKIETALHCMVAAGEVDVLPECVSRLHDGRTEPQAMQFVLKEAR